MSFELQFYDGTSNLFLSPVRCTVKFLAVYFFKRDFYFCLQCCKPVIAAVHGACIGAGVDMISGADIRLCSEDAWFQIKEVEIGEVIWKEEPL